MLTLSEPRIIERGPYKVVGAHCAYAGDDEGPGWTGAETDSSDGGTKSRTGRTISCSAFCIGRTRITPMCRRASEPASSARK